MSARLFKKQIPFNMYLWMNSIYHYRTQNHNSMIIPSTIKQLFLNLCQSHTCLKYTGSPIAFFSIICWRNQVICPLTELCKWPPCGITESVKSCQLLSHIWLFVAPWTVACSTSLSMEFFGQENWSGKPFPSPRKSNFWPRDQTWVSHIAGRFFTVWATKEAPVRSTQEYVIHLQRGMKY